MSIKQAYDKSNIIIAASKKSDDFVEITIRDHGSGFDKKQIEVLLKPEKLINSALSFEDKNLYLGINISKGIIENLQGILKIESEHKKGSCYTFYFPAGEKV